MCCALCNLSKCLPKLMFATTIRRYATSTVQGKDLYEILGLKPTATHAEIREAFLIKSKQIHPDRNPDSDNHDQFIVLNEAYQILGKKTTRREYDFCRKVTIEAKQQNIYRKQTTESGETWEQQSANDLEKLYRTTLWEKRDKSQDKHYEEWNKINELRNLPTLYIFLFCGFLVAVSVVIHFRAAHFYTTNTRLAVDRRTAEYEEVLQQLRAKSIDQSSEQTLDRIEEEIKWKSPSK